MSGWVCVSVCVHVCVSLVLSASSPGTGAIRLWRSFKQLLSLNVEQLMRPLGTSRRTEEEEEKKGKRRRSKPPARAKSKQKLQNSLEFSFWPQIQLTSRKYLFAHGAERKKEREKEEEEEP